MLWYEPKSGPQQDSKLTGDFQGVCLCTTVIHWNKTKQNCSSYCILKPNPTQLKPNVCTRDPQWVNLVLIPCIRHPCWFTESRGYQQIFITCGQGMRKSQTTEYWDSPVTLVTSDAELAPRRHLTCDLSRPLLGIKSFPLIVPPLALPGERAWVWPGCPGKTPTIPGPWRKGLQSVFPFTTERARAFFSYASCFFFKKNHK